MQRDENAVDALWAAGLYYVLFRNRVNIRLAYHKGEKEKESMRDYFNLIKASCQIGMLNSDLHVARNILLLGG